MCCNVNELRGNSVTASYVLFSFPSLLFSLHKHTYIHTTLVSSLAFKKQKQCLDRKCLTRDRFTIQLNFIIYFFLLFVFCRFLSLVAPLPLAFSFFVFFFLFIHKLIPPEQLMNKIWMIGYNLRPYYRYQSWGRINWYNVHAECTFIFY